MKKMIENCSENAYFKFEKVQSIIGSFKVTLVLNPLKFSPSLKIENTTLLEGASHF